MNPTEVYQNASAAIYYLQTESDIDFHMPMGMDPEDAENFTNRFNESIDALNKLLECYSALLDTEELNIE